MRALRLCMLWGSDEADKGSEKEEEKVVFRTWFQQLPKLPLPILTFYSISRAAFLAAARTKLMHFSSLTALIFFLPSGVVRSSVIKS